MPPHNVQPRHDTARMALHSRQIVTISSRRDDADDSDWRLRPKIDERAGRHARRAARELVFLLHLLPIQPLSVCPSERASAAQAGRAGSRRDRILAGYVSQQGFTSVPRRWATLSCGGRQIGFAAAWADLRGMWDAGSTKQRLHSPPSPAEDREHVVVEGAISRRRMPWQGGSRLGWLQQVTHGWQGWHQKKGRIR